MDRIIVYSVDRRTRKLRHLQVLLQTFEQHDVSLHVVTDPHFGSSAIARLMSNIIAAASEFQHKSSGNTPLEAIRSSWRELNMRTQTNLRATIIKEVIFDPDAGAIVVTLVDDAVERIMTAKSDGSPTR